MKTVNNSDSLGRIVESRLPWYVDNDLCPNSNSSCKTHSYNLSSNWKSKSVSTDVIKFGFLTIILQGNESFRGLKMISSYFLRVLFYFQERQPNFTNKKHLYCKLPFSHYDEALPVNHPTVDMIFCVLVIWLSLHCFLS